MTAPRTLVRRSTAEAEFRELLRMEEDGKLLDFEEVLADLEKKWRRTAGEAS